jgi:hypothetical protein
MEIVISISTTHVCVTGRLSMMTILTMTRLSNSGKHRVDTYIYVSTLCILHFNVNSYFFID